MHAFEVLIYVRANQRIEKSKETEGKEEASVVSLRRSRLMLHDPVPCEVNLFGPLSLKAEQNLDGFGGTIVK